MDSAIIFSDKSKKICMCTFISMVLIIIFMVSPISNLIKTSAFMKVIILILLFYTVKLNLEQIGVLRASVNNVSSQQVMQQINLNTICGYAFIVFVGVLILLIIKSFF